MKDIYIKAEGFRLVPDWAVAGTRGSYGVSRLIFEFSDNWDGLYKTVTFFPGGREGGVKLIMNDNTAIIPPEVLSVAGNSTFVVDGFREGVKLISLVGRLRVVDTATPGGVDSVEPTPSELEQLRLSIGNLEKEAKETENSIRGELESISSDISTLSGEIKKQHTTMVAADNDLSSRINSLRDEMILLNKETLEREDFINECITQNSAKINANANSITALRSELVRTNAETKSELDALRASVPTVEDGREGNIVVFGEDGALVDSGRTMSDGTSNTTHWGDELVSYEEAGSTSLGGGARYSVEKPGRYLIINTSHSTPGKYSIAKKQTPTTESEYSLSSSASANVILSFGDILYLSDTLTASWLSYALPYPLGVADDYYINCHTGEIFICISKDDEHSYWLFYDRLNIESTDGIPAHWNEHLDEQMYTINYLTEEGCQDSFSFIVMTDMHYEDNPSMLSPLIAKKIADECNIKHILCLGDLQTEKSAEKNELYINEEWKSIASSLEPIKDRLLMTQGEYDGTFGNSDGEDTPSFRLPRGTIYRQIFAPVSAMQNAVFSSDGRGYFVDDISHKVRYIMLSSYANSDRTNVEGAILYKNSDNFRFGTPQLTLVRDALMSIPSDDYSVVIASHRPLDRDGSFTAWGGSGTGGDAVDRYGEATLMIRLLNAYVGRESFSGSFEGTQTDDDGKYDSSGISADFSSAKGRLIGFFSGGTHRDEAFEPGTAENGGEACDFFVFTTRCDGFAEFDSEKREQRAVDSTTEQCFDVFTVNKKTGLVYATRIGVGSDREFYI